MDNEVKYHEQSEGWTHEYLANGTCICFQRPNELGGGFVTVDFKQRIFATGYGKPTKAATETVYIGRDWRNRIIRDAIDHLERLMTGTKAG